MKNRQIDNKTKQVRVRKDLHQALKILASEEGITIKALIEEILKDYGIVEVQKIESFRLKEVKSYE